VEDFAVRTRGLLPSVNRQQELCGAQYCVDMTVRFFVAVSFPSSSSAAAAAAASALRRFSLVLRVFGNCCVFVVVEVTLLWFLLCVPSGIRTLRICSLCCCK
jgi:hypothetical protein